MTKHTTQYDEDQKALAQAKADTLAQQEAEADAYGEAQVAEAPVEPERFASGGAPYHEIETWRAEHGA